MKKISLVLLLMSTVLLCNAQKLEYPNFSTGYLNNFSNSGISVKANLAQEHSVQLFAGIEGPFSSYVGRYISNFKEIGRKFLTQPYIFSQVGLYTYEHIHPAYMNLQNVNEVKFSLGLGLGVEFELPKLSNNLSWNFEVSYNKIDFDNYLLAPLMVAAGVHYNFEI